MSTGSKNILLADDDTEDQELLETVILQLEPTIQIHAVMNGQQAVDFLMNCPDVELPALIILDYKMPLLNAAEVLGQLQNNLRYAVIPKVVWSSSNQPEHIKRCVDKGAANYFVKPNKMAELLEMARQMLALCNMAIGK